MANHLRKAKLEALLQGTIAKFLFEHQSDFDISATVLVDEVIMSPDLKSAKVWLGFSPSDIKKDPKQFEKILMYFNKLKSYLFKQMRVRRVPHITLQLSNSENAFKLEQIFDTLKSHDRGKNQTDINGIEEDSAGSTS